MSEIILTNWVGETGVPKAIEARNEGASPLDSLISAVRHVELDQSIPHVGLGGDPNALGEMELDGAVMDGDTLNAGAIGGLKGYGSAVEVAKEVMERSPHVMIVGEGAARFAKECGFQEKSSLSEEARKSYVNWKREKFSLAAEASLESESLIDMRPTVAPHESERDTVVFLMRSSAGSIVGATATSGWSYKYPGRLGDSPVIGAGLYVDSEYGGCVCTHTGEMSIRAGTARSVVLYMKKGATVEEACQEALQDLSRLKEGYLGALVIHALDKEGNISVVINKDEECPFFYSTDSQIGRSLAGVFRN